jgi:hypothetical protein
MGPLNWNKTVLGGGNGHHVEIAEPVAEEV